MKQSLAIVLGTSLLIGLSFLGNPPRCAEPLPEELQSMEDLKAKETAKNTSQLEDLAISVSEQYMERHPKVQLKDVDTLRIKEKLRKDRDVDALAGVYRPTNIFADFASIEPMESIQTKIQVFDYPDGEKALEITDKSMPQISFCFYVSPDQDGKIAINNSFVHGYTFLHWGNTNSTIIKVKNIYSPLQDARKWSNIMQEEYSDQLYGLDS